MHAVTDLFESGITLENFLSLLADGTEHLLKEQQIVYQCNCSKEKFANSLSKIDKQTLDAMIYEDKGAEIVCHFCHKKYHFDEEELINLKSEKAPE